MSDKAETMELKLHANRGEWVATVHTVRCTAPWLVKLGEKFYVRTSEPGESSFVYDHAERALSMTEVENAFDANLSVEVSRVEYAGTGVRTTGEVADAGFMPLAEDGAVFRCISAECGALAFKRELQRDGSCMCGASVHRLGGVPADQYRTLKATIAEQSAEIERLKEAVETIEVGRERDHEKHLLAEAEASSWILQQNNKIAALEAERDALKDELERVRKAGLEALHGGIGHRERAEKYLAVIRAKDAEIGALSRWCDTMLLSARAMSEAGLQVDVEDMTKEPTHE